MFCRFEKRLEIGLKDIDLFETVDNLLPISPLLIVIRFNKIDAFLAIRDIIIKIFII